MSDRYCWGDRTTRIKKRETKDGGFQSDSNILGRDSKCGASAGPSEVLPPRAFRVFCCAIRHNTLLRRIDRRHVRSRRPGAETLLACVLPARSGASSLPTRAFSSVDRVALASGCHLGPASEIPPAAASCRPPSGGHHRRPSGFSCMDTARRLTHALSWSSARRRTARPLLMPNRGE